MHLMRMKHVNMIILLLLQLLLSLLLSRQHLVICSTLQLGGMIQMSLGSIGANWEWCSKMGSQTLLLDLCPSSCMSFVPRVLSLQEHVNTHHRTINQDKENLLAWHKCLGFPTMEVMRQILLNIMQMVHTLEAETCEYMRDHFQAHLRMLWPHCINDTLFTGTCFSSVMSVCGYDKFQMFSFYHCERLLESSRTLFTKWELLTM
jgi:hypothetical protein